MPVKRAFSDASSYEPNISTFMNIFETIITVIKYQKTIKFFESRLVKR